MNAVEVLWPGREARVTPLSGGITNRNFKVEVDGESYVLRIGGRDTELLGIDRYNEHEASIAASRVGIAPEVLRYQSGYLVTRFVDGEPGRIDDVEEVARMLRRFHDSTRIGGRFDAFRVVEAYRATAIEHGVPIPADYDQAHEIARTIERLRADVPQKPCHNDLLAANFINDGSRLWIVDWEYAGMGDPYFDLGNFAVNNGLDEAAEARFLAAYGADDADGFVLVRFMSDFREAMWGVVQQALSELDVDFVAYAAEHFERLARTAAEPRFRAALG
ncbi:MAG: phosphotransferase [Gaiellaceae bacterium]